MSFSGLFAAALGVRGFVSMPACEGKPVLLESMEKVYNRNRNLDGKEHVNHEQRLT